MILFYTVFDGILINKQSNIFKFNICFKLKYLLIRCFVVDYFCIGHTSSKIHYIIMLKLFGK